MSRVPSVATVHDNVFDMGVRLGQNRLNGPSDKRFVVKYNGDDGFYRTSHFIFSSQVFLMGFKKKQTATDAKMRSKNSVVMRFRITP